MFIDWLSRLLLRGESVLEAVPSLQPNERRQAERLVREAFAANALDLAGPTIPFDAGIAVAAAELLAAACWAVVAEEGPFESLPALEASRGSIASRHYSADVTLRFLPAVHSRAKYHDPESEFTLALERILRDWPLSGVLAGLDGAPTGALDFGGHIGLQMLYAERFVEAGQAGWLPADESARMWIDYIAQERGKPVPCKAPEEV